MAWSNWEDIEVIVSGVRKQVQGAPAVVSWVQDQLHVFIRGKSPDANVYHGTNKSKSWQWSQLPAAPPASTLENSLAAASWGPDRIDLFATGGDKKVYHYAWNGSSWDNAWSAVPGDGRTDSAPAASSWKKDRFDLYIRSASNNQLLNLHFENEPGKQWSAWSNVGGHMNALTGSPAAASVTNRTECFTLGMGGKRHLLQARYDGTPFDSITDSALRMKAQWANPDEANSGQIGGVVKDNSREFAGSPAAASLIQGNGRVDVFARSANNRLIHREFLNDHWTNRWEDLGSAEIVGDPGAVSFGVGAVLKRIDCFALGSSGMLKHTWWA